MLRKGTRLEIIRVFDGAAERSAVLSPGLLTRDDDDLKELARLLSIDPRHSYLLDPVAPHSVPAVMGARHTLLLALEEVPTRGPGKGGIYSVMDWVVDVLDEVMPLEDWGAALTQPALFQLNAIGKNKTYYVVVLSPVKRPNIKGAYIGDPHDSESPTLIFQ